MTQNEAILNYLNIHGSITQKEATDWLGVARLASRINDLHKQGHNIKSEMITVASRYGGKTKVAKYTLILEGQLELL